MVIQSQPTERSLAAQAGEREPDILFVGDPHGRFEHVVEIVLKRRPDAVVFLGDLQAPRPLEQELAAILGLTDIWYIPGTTTRTAILTMTTCSAPHSPTATSTGAS